jgi:hypothetical protein
MPMQHGCMQVVKGIFCAISYWESAVAGKRMQDVAYV